ncbi:MAG TPA: ABC transporter permease [Ktedonobacteraceae bacterium]
MHSWLKLTWVETKLFLREPGVYFALVFPLAFLFIFGSIYGNKPNAFLGGHGSLDYYLPAYIGILIIAVGFYSLPVAIINYRERGILFRLQATPLRPLTILSAQMSANFLMTTVGAIVLVVAGKLFYHVHITSSMPNVLIAYVISILSIFALGFLMASIVPNARVAPIIGTLLFLSMFYLSGATVPLKVYPQVVQQIAWFLPLTHAIKLMQDMWFGGNWFDHWVNVLALLGLLSVCLLLSAKLFRWR